MTAPVIEAVDLTAFEYEIPCAGKGCRNTAQWMVFGDHSIFGCPGHGPLCEFCRGATMAFASADRPKKMGRCKLCNEPRIEGPFEYRVIEL